MRAQLRLPRNGGLPMTRLRQPLRQLGAVKKRWASHHASTRAAVMARSRGRCESCGHKNVRLEWAHLFGRRHIIGEPWCSTPELTMALCSASPAAGTLGCHEKIDRHLDNELAWLLQEVAYVRLAEKYNTPTRLQPGETPTDGVRRIVRELEQQAA